MPISPAHSAAARQNGALSHGPTTTGGRQRSSQNAIKFNFFGSTRLLSGEDLERFNRLADTLYQELHPQNFLETRLVREMIDVEWRLQRVRDHLTRVQEKRMREISDAPDLDTAAQAFHRLANEGHTLTLLLRYETQFRRQFDKSLEQLMELRRHQASDEERRRKQAQQEELDMLKAIIEAPTPGELMGLYESDSPDDEDEEAEFAAETANSSPGNFQNEPSHPADAPRKQPQPHPNSPFAAAGGAPRR